MVPLGLLSPGEHGEITTIRAILGGRCAGCCGDRKEAGCRVEDMGLRVGKDVEVLSNGGGPVLVRIDESRIALDRGMAMKIMVKEVRR